MPIDISVTADVRAMQRDLKAIKAKLPSIAAASLNKLANHAQKEVISETAAQLRLPKSVVSKTVKDKAPAPRFRLSRASPKYLVATLKANSAGIQVTQIAGANIKPRNVPGRSHKNTAGGGTKAKGSRFYPGAFKARKGGVQRVWIMRSELSSVNPRPGKYKLGLLRIGINDRFLRAFKDKVEGPQGSAFFRREYLKAAERAISRAAIR